MRSIKRNKDLKAVSTTQVDGYRERLVKLIPSEIVAAYLAIDGLLKSNMNISETSSLYNITIWIVFAFLLFLTPVYLKKLMNVTTNGQLVISTVAFAIWVITMGGPFLSIFGSLTYLIGSVSLVLYTMLVPVIYK